MFFKINKFLNFVQYVRIWIKTLEQFIRLFIICSSREQHYCNFCKYLKTQKLLVNPYFLVFFWNIFWAFQWKKYDRRCTICILYYVCDRNLIVAMLNCNSTNIFERSWRISFIFCTSLVEKILAMIVITNFVKSFVHWLYWLHWLHVYVGYLDDFIFAETNLENVIVEFKIFFGHTMNVQETYKKTNKEHFENDECVKNTSMLKNMKNFCREKTEIVQKLYENCAMLFEKNMQQKIFGV